MANDPGAGGRTLPQAGTGSFLGPRRSDKGFEDGTHACFPGDSDGKESACNAGDWVRSLGWEDPLQEGMATHSIQVFLPGEPPWTEESGGLQPVGS